MNSQRVIEAVVIESEILKKSLSWRFSKQISKKTNKRNENCCKKNK